MSNKKLKLTLFEKINLCLSIITLVIAFASSNENLKYGGISFLAASSLSIIFIQLCKINFSKFEINILQVHIFISIFLGTILNFYRFIPNFDFWLHMFFGLLGSVLAFPLIRFFFDKNNMKIKNVSPSFIIFIAFCFSSTCGLLWEIYEFSVDHLFNLSTQNNSLLDTMTDIIANTIGAIIYCSAYYLKNKKQAK